MDRSWVARIHAKASDENALTLALSRREREQKLLPTIGRIRITWFDLEVN
jgi:hypothetical protein